MAKKLVRREIENLIPYPPGKPLEELEREMGIRGSIKLASNENPLGPSPMAVQAIRKALPALHRYPDGNGFYLRTKLSELFHLSFDQIILGNGSDEIIELAVRTFLRHGEHAIQPSPTFLVYENMVKAAGGKMTSVPLTNFKINLENIAAAITPATKIIFLNSPNNPTGSVISKDEMNRFLKRIPDDIMVVLDEAYHEFITDETAVRGLDLLNKHPGIIILRTFSKLYGLAGLRIGYGFSTEQIISYMNRVRQPFNVNSLAQVGAIAGLDDFDFISRSLKAVKSGLRYLFRHLDRMDIDYIPSQANFFLIKIPKEVKDLYSRLLKQGVIVRPMDSYGLPEYIRINAGLRQENERFINAFQNVLDGNDRRGKMNTTDDGYNHN